jgi:hypothetical protein
MRACLAPDGAPITVDKLHVSLLLPIGGSETGSIAAITQPAIQYPPPVLMRVRWLGGGACFELNESVHMLVFGQRILTEFLGKMRGFTRIQIQEKRQIPFPS